MSELTPNLKLFKYNTETDAKQPFSINDCMNANWDKIDASLGSLEICDIGMALYVDETKGLRRYLNGQIVDINTNTQAFLNRLKEITTLYPSLLCTEDEWQTAKTMSAFGQVGKFVFNYSGDEIVSVRIPAIVNVQGLFDLQNLGMTVSAGLPNITGGFTSTALYSNADTAAYGAFKGTTTQGVSPTGGGGSGSIDTFDASRSNSIYGKSNTVQQEQIQYPYFIQIATGSETENNIINEIELNNPFSLFDSKYSDHELNNLSWLKSEGQWNAKSVYPTAYNKLLKVYNGTETVEVLSVKLSTEEYTDYDFVLNTADETFRLPLKNHTADDSIEGLTLYFYVGETVQNANLIDAGRIEEQLANKADLTTPSIQASYLKTSYINGTSGYNIWSNGYCEQWGVATANPIVFLKKYKTVPVIVSGQWATNAVSVGYGRDPINVTTTQFKTETAPTSAYPVAWMAKGYLAEGQY